MKKLFFICVTFSGVEFIGPSSKSIMAMGDKIMSKRIAKQANVNYSE